MKTSSSAVSAFLLAAVVGVSPMMANADRDGGHGHGHQGQHQKLDHPQRWHGDIRAFQRHDFPRWRAGYWYHGHHGGHLGWWWVVGPSLWYYYPSVVYPYPDPYIPPIAAAPAVTPDPDLPPPPQNWYFCTSTKSYYPYAQTCPEGWKTVPVTPGDVSAE